MANSKSSGKATSFAPAGPPPPTPVPLPPVVQKWQWIAAGLSSAEKKTGYDILLKALFTGEITEIYDQAMDEFRRQRTLLQANGEWDTVCMQYRFRLADKERKRTAELPQGSRQDGVLQMDEDGTVWPVEMANHYPGGAHAPPVARTLAPPSTPPRPTATTAPADIEFPAGINSLAEWGMTIIEFGKFNGRGLMYHELAASEDKSYSNYRSWVSSHTGSTTGQCLDLGKYLLAYEKAHGSSGCMIPGTVNARKFGSPSSSNTSHRHTGPGTPRS